MKNIYITGIHGFIGETIRGIFEKYGYKVNAIPRNVLFEGGMALKEYIEDADVIVNLAGKSIMGRWTARGKGRDYAFQGIGDSKPGEGPSMRFSENLRFSSMLRPWVYIRMGA